MIHGTMVVGKLLIPEVVVAAVVRALKLTTLLLVAARGRLTLTQETSGQGSVGPEVGETVMYTD
jgi:hypothetical protein